MVVVLREVKETEKNEKEMKNIVAEDTPLLEPVTGVSKQRFLMLFIIVMNMIFGGILMITLSPVNNIVSRYYAVSPVKVEWLSNLVVICTIAALPGSYLVARWGVRTMVTIAVSLNFLSASLQYPGYRKDMFTLVLVSRVPYGVAYSILQTLPAKISAVWFPKHERATATGAGCMSAAVGASIGNLLAGYLIKEGDSRTLEGSLRIFYMIQLILAGLLFVLVLFFKEKPRVPPSLSCNRESVAFFESIKSILGCRNGLIMVHSTVMAQSVFGAGNVLINPLITSTFHKGYEKYIGLMGAIGAVLCVVSILVTSILADKYQRYKLESLVVSTLTALSCLCFFLVLYNTKIFPAVFVLNILFGSFAPTYIVLCIESMAETFYPVSEEKIGMISLFISTPYVFLVTFGLGVAVKNGYVRLGGYMIFAMCVLQVCLIALMKVEKKRSHVEVAVGPPIETSYST